MFNKKSKEMVFDDGELPTPPSVWKLVRKIAPPGSEPGEIAVAMEAAANIRMIRDKSPMLRRPRK